MSFFNLQEIDHHHHLRNQTEEHDHMDSGGSTGIRSYDCVFCQRGFTTAQALGGHMNIHRKDRANPTTTKPITSPTYKEPNNNNTNTNTILSNTEMLLEEDDYQVDVANTRLFYSSKTYAGSQNHLNNRDSSSFEGRVHRFLGSETWGGHNSSLRGGSAGHILGKRVQDHGHSKEGEELDLELRLGHYSW